MYRYKLSIVGTGDFAREVADLALDCGRHGGGLSFIAKDENEAVDKMYRGIDALYVEDKDIAWPYVLGMGNPQVRLLVGTRLEYHRSSSVECPVLIHPSTLPYDCVDGYHYISREIKFGEGALICAGCILTNRIWIGKHVILNLGCTIGHDCVIGDYAELSPGCHINGHTTIGRCVSLGSGVVTVPGAKIGDNCIIGAGAVVKGELTEPGVYVGIPAKKIK